MKKKTNRSFIFIVISFFIFLTSTCISYAVLNDRINMHGTAKTINLYPGTQLPQNNINLSSWSQDGTDNLLEFSSASVSGNVYTIRMKQTGARLSFRNHKFNIQFTNSTIAPFTNGRVVMERIAYDCSSAPLSVGTCEDGRGASLESTTVNPGQNVVVNLNMNVKWGLSTKKQIGWKITIYYTLLSVERNFIIYVYFDT